MKELPIGISNFELLIQRQNVYVDKTPLIFKMVDEGMFYFLSRPRRFGKSLLLSTLECLFTGRRELFEGLWIAQADWDWTVHPIVKFDLGGISHDTPEELKKALLRELHRMGKQAGLSLPEELLRNAFSELIIGLAQKHGQRVVVLIDEYDQPLISHLGKGKQELEVARQNREVLRDFFGVLKSGHVNDVLRFVFITGISKFTQVSIFSELNNLDDLSMQDAYTTLLGYTEEELIHFFAEHVSHQAQRKGIPEEEFVARIRDWYNGYRFSENAEPVYNPFSVLKVLKEGKFGNYWFETATPAFLVNLIKERQYPIPKMEGLRVTPAQFTTYDLDSLTL
ncbi:MAG: AAA family ATPase, partial [Calditrichaeota bacterium]